MSSLPETPSGWLGSSERDEALSRASERSAVARATGLMDALDPDLQAAFERTTRQVTRFLNVPVALFGLLDGECQKIVASSGYPGPEILPTDGSLCTHVRDSGRDLIIDDLSRHELGEIATNMTEAGANAYLGTPVYGPNGEPIGSLCAIDFPSRSWEPGDLDLLKALAEGLSDKIALLATLRRSEASEGRLGALMEAIPHVVVLSNPETGVDYISPQIREILGYDPEKIFGFGFYDHVIHPDDREGLRTRRQEFLGRPEPFEYEFRARHAGGAIVPMLLRGFPLSPVDGMVHSHVITFTEIGAIRRAEERAEEESRRLQGVIDVLPAGLVLADGAGRIVLANDEARTLFGDRFDLGREDEEWPRAFYVEPEGGEIPIGRENAPMSRALAGESVRGERTIRLVYADGTERFVKCDAEPLRGTGGGFDGVVLVVSDITDLRRAETRVEAERRAGDERLRTVFDSMPILTALIDLEGRITYVNETALSAAGVAVEDALGVLAWEAPFVAGNPEAAETMRSVIERGLRGEALQTEIAFVFQGRRLETLYYAVPILGPNGEVVSLSVSAVDVTERNETRTLIETERRVAADRMQAMLDGMPIWVGLVDPDGRLLAVNRAPVEQAGKTVEGVLGTIVWEEWTNGDPETTRILREVIAAAAGGERVTREMVYRWDGQEIETEYHAVPLRDADGNVTAISTAALDVTERNVARRRVEAEGEIMRQIMEHSPIMKGLCDAEGRVLYSNEAPLRAIGSTLDEVIGRYIWDTPWTVDPEIRRITYDAAQRAIAGETVLSEISYPSRNGMVEIEQRIAPIYGPDGTLRYLLPSAIDVTARNRAIRMIEAEGMQLRQILDNMPLLTTLCDPKGRLLYMNEAPLRAFGLRLEDARSRPIWEIARVMGPEFEEIFRDAYRRVIEGEAVRQELKVAVVHGHGIEVEHRMDAIRDEKGEIVSILSTAVDVTERNEAARDVEDERARLSTVVDILPSGVLIADARGRVTESNPEALKLFGEQAEEGAPNAWPPGFLIEADGSETPLTHETVPLERALKGETVREARTIRIVTPAGESRWIKCDAVPIHDAEGTLDGAVMTALDITDLERARQDADRARADSFARLQRVIDSLPINVVLADPQGVLLYANETPLRGAGLTLKDVVGKLAWESPWVPNEETARIIREEYMKAAAGEISKREFSIRMGETVIDIDHSVVPIFDAEGNVEYLLPSSIDVTARNRALRLAEDERRRLSETVEGMPVGLFVFDHEMSLIQANEEAIKATGMTPERLNSGYLPQMWFIEPDGTEVPTEHKDVPSWRALQGRDGRENRPMRLHHEGTSPEDDFFVRIEAAPLTNAEGGIEGAIVTAVDVKPLLMAEKALADEREAYAAVLEAERRRLTQIVQSLPIGFFIFDKDRKIVHANEEGLVAFGLSRAQMEAQDYAEAFYLEPDGREIAASLEDAPLRRALRGESGREPRVMRLHRPGTEPREDKYIRAEAAALTGPEGSIDGAIFTVTDVKPLREAEIALAREREAATERLTATLEGISIFIGLLDLEGRIVWCNRAPLDASGLTFADVENVKYADSAWVNHDPEMMRRIADATRKAASGEHAFTPIVARRVGGFMDVDITLAPILGDEGQVRYLIASGIEVTARNVAMRQIEDARMSAERAREIAERATRAKDEFLAVLSHELRTPLTPAMLGLELLGGDLDEILPSAKDPEIAASILETMATVRSNLDIQVRLIDDLLDVTRIARGKLELRKSPVDLHEAARHALSIVAPKAEEKQIVTGIVAGAPRTTILADPARLRQILWNLLANAVKFTGGGGEVRIETEDAGPGMVRLKVIDTGVGIDPERLGSIFDAFDQGEGAISRGFGGLGLGLAIARSLARAHGGTLWASSAGRDRGATFVLELPTVEPRPASEITEVRRQVRQQHRGCRVLLIEDNLDTARFTSALLRRAEVEVEVAHSVHDALRVAEGRTYSAILTDIGLPDGDGVQAVQKLRATGIEAPAVAMSGYGRDEDKARTADAGFRAHLVKPLAFENLLEVLDAVLPEGC